jgi:hypothetical protein
MDYEDSIREAARRADSAVWETMSAYRDRTVTEEPAITGALVMALRDALNGYRGEPPIAGLAWSAHILKSSSGRSAEESAYGADILFHVVFDTPLLKYSKGVLVQAKRVEQGESMRTKDHNNLISQCGKMLGVTPASYIFDYARREMRCGSALAIAGSTNRELYAQCVWTSYRFFLELFRCPIGDPRITSANVEDLPVPRVMKITASVA